MAATKKWSLRTAGDSLARGSGEGVRRWPLSYLLCVLFIVLLVPQVCYRVKIQAQSLKRAKSVFGDNLIPTPWHFFDTRRAPNRTWNRAFEILKCSYPGLPSSISIPSQKKQPAGECPSYFGWIARDLSPWKLSGITSANIDAAKEQAAFKIVISRGRLYVDLYYACVQTRAAFTVWGLLLLLEKFEGQIPDVEFLFDCMDRPQIRKANVTGGSPAPLFRYCSNSKHYDIPWPDWSFWGWAETELEPWEQELGKIVKGSKRKAWRLKAEKAHWRGNPNVASPLRMQLMQCNNATRDPHSAIFDQNWTQELASKKENSKLENQCDYRYKIYAEGFAWSVSFKYILACGSPTLAISPKYYDFYMRGLVPGVHYIPVRPSEICANRLCPAIDREVKFTEKGMLQSIRIGQAGQDFIRNEVSMSNVYDYMFHMLREYAALQRFKPSVPRTATEVTQSFILCLAQPHERLLLQESRRNVPQTEGPCHFPELPEKGVKDNGWEAEVHADENWIDQWCGPLPKKVPRAAKTNPPRKREDEQLPDKKATSSP